MFVKPYPSLWQMSLKVYPVEGQTRIFLVGTEMVKSHTLPYRKSPSPLLAACRKTVKQFHQVML